MDFLRVKCADGLNLGFEPGERLGGGNAAVIG